MGLNIVRLQESLLPRPAAGAGNAPSLIATLGPGLGAKLLMELFVGERSGKLVVRAAGAAVGTLIVCGGEPVHVEVDDLGARLERHLRHRGVYLERDPGGRAKHPIAVLTRRTNPLAVLEALRDDVRELCHKLIALEDGEIEFYDDDEALERAPFTALNPFGVIVSSRKNIPGLARAAHEIAAQYPMPLLGLAHATSRIRAFTGGVDLAELVDGTRRAADIFAQVGLDDIVGGLVLKTLSDTGLLKLCFDPTPRDARRRSPLMAKSDPAQLSQLAFAPERGGVEMVALYLEIKPETDVDAILGIEGSAGPATIERMYQQRLGELDRRAIPQGPNRPYLLARIGELRAKVERAYRKRTGLTPRETPAYEILQKIGVGGMAEVYLGRPTDDPQRLVAIKRILPELRRDPLFSRQFLDEARLARRVQHKNVVRIYAVGKSRDDLYLSMEYVDGLDLAELITRHRARGWAAPIDVVVKIAAEACAGLHAAHTACDRMGALTPILHRDVSPQNILVSRMGDVKLSDFGIAQALGHDPHVDNASEKDTVKGKVPYLAPELLSGSPASVQSDVYAMAMTIYAALAKLPFTRGNQLMTMRAIIQDPLPKLSELCDGGVPKLLDVVLQVAAAKDPKERHDSALALQLELEAVLTTRPPVDVAAWARSLAERRKIVPVAPADRPRMSTPKFSQAPSVADELPISVTSSGDGEPVDDITVEDF